MVDNRFYFSRIVTMTARTLTEMLDDVSVMSPGQWENDIGPKDWYAVVNDDGIIAYFAEETLALGFRLWYINSVLNPVKE